MLPSGCGRRDVTLNSHLHASAPPAPCSVPGALGFLCQPAGGAHGAVKAVPPSELEDGLPPPPGNLPVKGELPRQVPQPGGLNSRRASAHSSGGRPSELKVLAEPLPPDLSPRLVAGCLLPVPPHGHASVQVCVRTPPLIRTPSPPPLPHFRFSVPSNTRSPGALES